MSTNKTMSTVQINASPVYEIVDKEARNSIETVRVGVKTLEDNINSSNEKLSTLNNNVSSLTKDTANKITKFYASNYGETHLVDSDNGKIMDMIVYGKSEQKTTNGYNLIDCEKINASNTINGVTYTNNGDGSITVNGTSTENSSFIVATIKLQPGTYRMQCNDFGDGRAIYCTALLNNKWDKIINNTTFTIQDETPVYVRLVVNKGNKAENMIARPILSIGTELHDFEPYTGGIPSPSPDYPQEIKSVGDSGSVAVKVMGKDLIPTNCGQNTTALRYDAQYNRWAFDALKAVGLVNARIIDPETAHCLLSAGTYTITLVSFENVQNVTISAVNADWKTLASVTPDRPSKTFSVDANTIVGCYFVPKDANATGYLQVQLELGTTPTSYEPYTEQSVQLPYTLNAIPVTSGGNVTIDGQQYIADRVVEKDGIFGIERNIRKIHTNTKTMNNNDEYPGWNKVEGISDVTYYSVQPQGYSREVTYISNFTQIPFLQNNKKTNNILYCLKSQIGYSQTELIAKAIDVDMYIRLQDAIFEPLPGDIQAKLRTLVTNYPVTNISITSDQLDGYTVFHYPISMAEGWNYVKQQINDNRDYIYDMDAKTQDIDIQSAEAYVNSEYAVALTELEV